jgi:hypothetical protein
MLGIGSRGFWLERLLIQVQIPAQASASRVRHTIKPTTESGKVTVR